jgi:hypothetical protein
MKDWVRQRYRSLRERLRTPAGRAATVVGFIASCLAIYGFFFEASEPAPALSAEESHLLSVMPQKLGKNCRPYDPEFDQRYAPLVSADVECAPLDPGPDSVNFHLFTTPRNLELFMRRQRNEMLRFDVNCTSGNFPYSSAWVDSGGKAMGELQCGDYSSRSRLLWSYDDLLVVASAGSRPAGAGDLHAWWQRHVRFNGGDPPAGLRRHLEGLLPESFGRCEPEPILLPMSIAGVDCYPGDGISSAGAELFANREMLQEYIENQGDVSGIGDESCKETRSAIWSTGGRRPTGRSWGTWYADRSTGRSGSSGPRTGLLSTRTLRARTMIS